MRNILFCFVVMLLFSCGLSNKTKERRKLEQQKMERSEFIKKIVSNYNIAYCWDTLNFSYSIDFKPVISTKYQLIENYFVNDIYEKEDCMYASISIGFVPEYYFDFPISKEQENILKEERNEFIVCEKILVVSITEIRKVKEGESVNLDDSFAFIGNGKLIDIISKTKK